MNDMLNNNNTINQNIHPFIWKNKQSRAAEEKTVKYISCKSIINKKGFNL